MQLRYLMMVISTMFLLPGGLLAQEKPRMYFTDTSSGRPIAKDPKIVQFKNKYWMYYSIPGKDGAGWHIGIAQSNNLMDWQKVGDLNGEEAYEKNGLCAPGALVRKDTIHLFYQTYGNGPKDAICHAYSTDGIHFVKNSSNPVFRPTGSWTSGRAIDAEVTFYKDQYFLYFATRDPKGEVQMQGVATAPAGTDFSRADWKQAYDGTILKPELPWEGKCIEAASVIEKNGLLYMFYAGSYNNVPQQIGLAESKDGIHWKRTSEKPFLANGKAGEWNHSESGHPDIFKAEDGKYYLFFQGNNTGDGKSWYLSNMPLKWENETFSPAQSSQTASAKTTDQQSFKIETGKKVWLLTYFRQRYPTRIEIDAKGNTVEVPLPNPMLLEKMHMALSTDGRHWTPLNNNKPVWDQHVRDPYVRRGPDGLWRILSTGGGGKDREKVGPSCLYLTSPDLIHWQVEGTLPLMKDVRNESGALLARNIWAPEWFYDKKSKEYILIWSSSFEDAGWKKSRLWYCTTRDWKVFSPAKVFFEPSYSVIDGTLLEHQGKYYLFHKEEEFGSKTGERRAIRVATATNVYGPYKVIEGPLNNGQIVPVITEGPTVIKDPNKKGWLLLYDYCMTDRFGASYSPDLLHWKVEEDVKFPPEARHGCVSIISSEEAKALMTAFQEKTDGDSQ
ncbi:family 43 glycosylhydrolase [Chitinophaga sp. S165]|uniref:family 43 glycosylhydrolase n=1 Tax=Chitinophaga sp. S165 TaxID=2135462 RepID=UPI000D99286E|nr:family 43 glycosylhydrolase [Chitinophaga sp. S165]PWV56381.1 glycosyl hydrolase family 43 [Chitinophaga sp. S165]